MTEELVQWAGWPCPGFQRLPPRDWEGEGRGEAFDRSFGPSAEHLRQRIRRSEVWVGYVPSPSGGRVLAVIAPPAGQYPRRRDSWRRWQIPSVFYAVAAFVTATYAIVSELSGEPARLGGANGLHAALFLLGLWFALSARAFVETRRSWR